MSLAGVIAGVWVVVRVEQARRRSGPARAVALARRMGADRPSRSREDREKLRRNLKLLDRLFLGRSNCYRRALLEMAFDSSAAAEKLFMGLKVTGEPRSGHAWLASGTESRSFDAILSL